MERKSCAGKSESWLAYRLFFFLSLKKGSGIKNVFLETRNLGIDVEVKNVEKKKKSLKGKKWKNL